MRRWQPHKDLRVSVQLEVMEYKGLEAGTHRVVLKEKTRRASQPVCVAGAEREEGRIGIGCEVRETGRSQWHYRHRPAY